MTVLVVDDQISVVSAILSGIAWQSIGVSKVLKAFNAFEAKMLIRAQQIDVMLCDIEMPGEDGLQLFRWVRANDYDTECVFLTSHADFLYAKEALHLGGIDYILQPARYEDIQAAVKRALAKVNEKREQQSYSTYGRFVKTQNALLVDSLLGKWLAGPEMRAEKLQTTFDQLQIDLKVTDTVCCALLQIMGENRPAEDGNADWFRYGLTNIITEIANEYGQKVILLRQEPQEYTLILFQPGQMPLGRLAFSNFLTNVLQICDTQYHTRMAAFSGGEIMLQSLPAAMQKLQESCKNNVIGAARVFAPDECVQSDAGRLRELDYQRWNLLAKQGNDKAIGMEMKTWLHTIEEKRQFSAEALQEFYQRYLQIVFALLNQKGVSLQELLPMAEDRAGFLNSGEVTSIQQAKNIVSMVDAAFSVLAQENEEEQDIVQNIVRFVHNHIEEDIRRADIAAELHLSQDHISHLFSKQMQMPLVEFITEEKMKLAQSLLRSTALPIGVIAAKVGYSNFSYFSKTYKKKFGVSPATAKKQQGSGAANASGGAEDLAPNA